jgi:hypothetical protein
VRRTLCGVRCAAYAVRRTLCGVRCAAYAVRRARVRCTLYAVRCTLYAVRVYGVPTVYLGTDGVRCTLYAVRCTLYAVRVYGVRCTVYAVRCTVYAVRCTVYGVRCTLYAVRCTSTLGLYAGAVRCGRTPYSLQLYRGQALIWVAFLSRGRWVTVPPSYMSVGGGSPRTSGVVQFWG